MKPIYLALLLGAFTLSLPAHANTANKKELAQAIFKDVAPMMKLSTSALRPKRFEWIDANNRRTFIQGYTLHTHVKHHVAMPMRDKLDRYFEKWQNTMAADGIDAHIFHYRRGNYVCAQNIEVHEKHLMGIDENNNFINDDDSKLSYHISVTCGKKPKYLR